jgi:hypothetical protein
MEKLVDRHSDQKLFGDPDLFLFARDVVLPSKLDKSQCYSGGLLLGWVA